MYNSKHITQTMKGDKVDLEVWGVKLKSDGPLAYFGLTLLFVGFIIWVRKGGHKKAGRGIAWIFRKKR